MREIDNIVKLIDSTNYHSSKVKSDFVERAFNEQLRQIADTCKYPLVSLYALHKSQYESDIKTNEEFYQDFVNKWHEETSPYFEVFRSKIPKPKSVPSSSLYYLFGLLMAFGLGYFLRQLTSGKTKNEKLLQTLSLQERRIFELLQKGKSNKEISDELNVGISTVKSHVSSIYSKLNLKSRKEVLNFKS
jgi:DNA-binding CsgD family transcriptional regulator